MKKLKNLLAVILCLTTILSFTSFVAYAGGDMFGNWGVTWNGTDEEFTVIDIENVTETKLVVPETINDCLLSVSTLIKAMF